eukprot:1982347-Rhodomonas_salina.1
MVVPGWRAKLKQAAEREKKEGEEKEGEEEEREFKAFDYAQATEETKGKAQAHPPFPSFPHLFRIDVQSWPLFFSVDLVPPLLSVCVTPATPLPQRFRI